MSEPLLHTAKGRERVLVAISWDVRVKKTTIMDHLRGTNQQHDLDLSCFVYDKAGNYVDYISSMAQDSMDQSGCIYHSGDDASGAGGGDDESISCELAGLAPEIDQLIFVTEIRSAHVFEQVEGSTCRVADGASDKNLHELEMAVDKGKDRAACVMLKIFRGPGSPTGWHIGQIDDYPDLAQVEDWGAYLTRYL